MQDTGNTPRVNPEAVGQERPSEREPGKAVGGWFGVGALTWIVVILLAVAFVVAIIVAGVAN